MVCNNRKQPILHNQGCGSPYRNKSTYYHKEKKAKKKVVAYLGRGVAVNGFCEKYYPFFK